MFSDDEVINTSMHGTIMDQAMTISQLLNALLHPSLTKQES